MLKDSCRSAISVNSADGVLIKNNTIDAPDKAAIVVDLSRNVEITGNKLTNAPEDALKIGDNCDRSSVTIAENTGFDSE